MKKIILLILTLISFFNITNTGFAGSLDIFQDKSEVIYCKSGECSMDKGTQLVKDDLEDIEKNRKASVYIQDIVKYLLGFVSIVAVLYIIYAGFKMLTSAGDDKAQGEVKKTITSVLIGIVIMWLAYSIVKWLIALVLV